MIVDPVVATPTVESARQVSHSLLIRYATGQIGAQIFRDTPAVLLPIFLTTMLGVPPWMAGIAILIPKAWIVFADPLAGSIFDRKKSSWGRLPFLAIGALCTSIGVFVLFRPVDFAKAYVGAAYISFVYLLAATGFSAYAVPYLAIASELASSYHERTKIFAYRISFTMIGIIVGVGVAQPLVGWIGGGAKGWSGMASIVSMICLVTMMVPVIGLRGRRFTEQVIAPAAFFHQLHQSLQNTPFVILIATRFLQSIGQSCSYSAIGLVFIYALNNESLLLPFILVMGAGSLASQPFMVRISNRAGKRTTLYVSVIIWCSITLTWLMVRPDHHVIVHLPLFGGLTAQHLWALVRAFLIGIFNSGFELMSFSLLTDTIAYDRVKFGRASEGIFSGIYSANEKLAFALGPAIAGIILSVSGFAASKGGAIAQSAAAIDGIMLNYSVVPVVIFLASLIIFRLYNLTEADVLTR